MKTDFTQISFDQTKHTYTYEDQVLTGVTRRLAQLKKPFDRGPWAMREAEKLGISVETFLKEQDEDFRRRMQRGNDVHSWIAQTLRAELNEAIPPVTAGGFPEIHAFKDFWNNTHASNDTRLHQVEWIIGDVEFGLAGTVDALLFNQETELAHLWDWKTGTKFQVDNRFQNLLPPFVDLEDCELV